jgi:hypothetical protein
VTGPTPAEIRLAPRIPDQIAPNFMTTRINRMDTRIFRIVSTPSA